MTLTATPAPPSRTMDPSLQKWLDEFAQKPLDALERLLYGKVWLSGYESAEVAQALPQFLPVTSHESLDGALCDWLARQLRANELPEGVSAKTYARALVNVFGLLQAIDLPRTRGWCTEHVVRLWHWLKSQPAFPSRDARPGFLRALTISQPNRGLLRFWASLCGQGQPDYAQLALFGLRRMPKDDDGAPERGIPRALIQGLLEYGRAAALSGDTRKKEWLSEVDFLTAVYPMSKDGWAAPFRDAMAGRQPAQRVRNWLDERYPAANQHTDDRKAKGQPLVAPYWDTDVKPLVDKFDSDRERVVSAITAQFERHRHYARESGDYYYLVRSFCRLANFLLNRRHDASGARDPAWALDIAQEAATWAPSNPYTWSVLGRSLDELGDWQRAQAVFWYARRRFPHNPKMHSQLGHALAMRGLVDEGEVVYRQAIRRFSDNAFCWSDLAHTLRIAGRREEAVAVYREAQDRFPRDHVLATGLAGTLIDLGRKDEASAALELAVQVSPDDSQTQAVLRDLKNRLAALQVGAPMPMKHPNPTKEGTAGDFGMFTSITGTDITILPAMGRATLWRNAGHVEEARKALADIDCRSAISDVEHGLLLVLTDGGWRAARDSLERCAARYQGDGTVQVHFQRARARCGEPADWQSLRGRFEELAPVMRVEQMGDTKLPVELSGNELDEDGEQAKWVYLAGAEQTLRDVVQEDFLAARQIAL
jgi:Flp pilus assembly protein TadD